MPDQELPRRARRRRNGGRLSALLTKHRVETLSDSVFAIVMTILVLDIKVPVFYSPLTDTQLQQSLQKLWLVFGGYVVSFLVLSMFWMSHHVLFHAFSKNVNRQIVSINTLFLLFVAFIPFSTHLLGVYHEHRTAIFIYGTNVVIIGLMLVSMFIYALNSREIKNGRLSEETVRKVKTRIMLPPVFAVLAMLASPYSIPASLFLFAFPIVFNIIPGSLTAIERMFQRS